LTDYPYLEREDILQALRYAAGLAEDREVVLPRAWSFWLTWIYRGAGLAC